MQINVQSVGDPWRTSGALATDGRHTYLLHNGKLSGRMEFARRYPGQRTTMAWRGRSTPLPYFVVGRLEDRHFAKQLGTFVHAVASFKDGGTLAESIAGRSSGDSMRLFRICRPASGELTKRAITRQLRRWKRRSSD